MLKGSLCVVTIIPFVLITVRQETDESKSVSDTP